MTSTSPRMTAEQICVATHALDRHGLVSAVPGSGKSTVLIERVCHLIQSGVSADRILVLMFNRAAQQHFAQRMLERLGHKDVEVMTFHAKGLVLCKELVERGSLPPFRVLSSESDLRAIVSEALSLAHDGAKSRVLPYDAADRVLIRLGLAHNDLPPDTKSSALIEAAARTCARLCRERNLMTFADMISRPVELAHGDHSIGQHFGGRYDQILVDEFQDVSATQLELLRLLAAPSAKILAVGDEDQAIYGWRGACPQFMLDQFDAVFGETTRYTLSQTFRFGPALAIASSFSIARNVDRAPKTCRSSSASNTTLSIRTTDAMAEAALERVARWQGAGRSLNECVVLVREYAAALDLQILALERGLRVTVEGEATFLRSPVFLRLWAWLQHGIQGAPRDPEVCSAWIQGLCVGSGLDAQARKLLSYDAQLDPDGAYREFVRLCQERLRSLPHHAPDGQRLRRTLECHALMGRPASAGGLLRALLTTTEVWQNASKHSERRLLNALRLFVHATETQEPMVWLARLQAILNPDLAAGATEALTITSIHRAKGKEYPLVLLYGLEDGLFPRHGTSLEEERRLFYVGATRAQEELALFCPRDEYLRQHAEQPTEEGLGHAQLRASRFVYEMQPVRATALACNAAPTT